MSVGTLSLATVDPCSNFSFPQKYVALHENCILCRIMRFRADEERKNGTEEAIHFLTRNLKDKGRNSEHAVSDIILEHGPVIRGYPSWHPLITASLKDGVYSPYPVTGITDSSCKYTGLDHIVCFRNAFLSCPYDESSAESLIESVQGMVHPAANIGAERLDVPLYAPLAKPVLVTCEWHPPMSNRPAQDGDGTIPRALAIPLILEQELPHWRTAEVAETWKKMSPFLLGRPHGARSSLFVNQETGLTIKKVWETLISTGMFGSIYVA